jgi:DNA helicase II / ATP-dependent DNA helicase PcrA
MEYEKAFARLNERQKQAVETLLGPVMVVAGPGTGKTETLALRVAHLLRSDLDVAPQQILCLTFTDAGVQAMQQRLLRYIGSTAYQVNVHTFHSFGSLIMARYGEYFRPFTTLEPVDEIKQDEILQNILKELDGASHRDMTRKDDDGNYLATKALLSLIKNLKKTNWTPEQYAKLTEESLTEVMLLQGVLDVLMQDGWLTGTARSAVDKAALLESSKEALEAFKDVQPATTELSVRLPASLAQLVVSSLEQAITDSDDSGKTTPITAWRTKWLEKNDKDQFVFKDLKRTKRLVQTVEVFGKYQAHLQAHGQADFEDQIAFVVEALKANDELRYSVQEAYQYLMVDEFQDTNPLQMTLIELLTHNEHAEGQPNIMAVGDDDQAVYKFQGADLTNLLYFMKSYPQAAQIVLSTNYRSTSDIIHHSRRVAKGLNESLEKKGLEKMYEAFVSTLPRKVIAPRYVKFASKSDEALYALAHIQRIVSDRQSYSAPKTGGASGTATIAIIARQRKHLHVLQQLLEQTDIPYSFDRKTPVFEQEHIVTLLLLSECVNALNVDPKRADILLPRILSHPMWSLSGEALLEIAQSAQQTSWSKATQSHGSTNDIYALLSDIARTIATSPYEATVDSLLGNTHLGEKRVSPFKEYYTHDTPELLQHDVIADIRALRDAARAHFHGEQGSKSIEDFLDFVRLRQKAAKPLTAPRPTAKSARVHLLTAHGAKGLEFNTVIVVGASSDNWKPRIMSSMLPMPAHLAYIQSDENTDDDELRLFYVAMTRAQDELIMSYSGETGDKIRLPYAPLAEETFETIAVTERTTNAEDAAAGEATRYWSEQWRQRYASPVTLPEAIQDKLKNYKLNATGLNNFLNLRKGGPKYFLTQNILHFPERKNINAEYGTLVHQALALTIHITDVKARTKQALDHIEQNVHKTSLSLQEQSICKAKAQSELPLYLQHNHDDPTITLVEVAATAHLGENPTVLTGNMDILSKNTTNKTLKVVDLKTGKPTKTWKSLINGTAESSEAAERLKNYRNQLLFYKVLLDNSMEWGKQGWRVEQGALRYIQPHKGSDFSELILDYETEETERFKLLVRAVQACLQRGELPRIDSFELSIAGIRAFEEMLIATYL